MTEIRRLDEATVERIAAGEVVERPASVVKELVENSLDADASRVDVTVESGGTEGITVSDDGIGMTEEEVRTAVEEHTTSKIRDIDDLEAGVATLGFRGEALHAIGAVSRLTVTTRPRADRDVESYRGTKLTVEGGEVTGVDPAGCPEGTTIEIDDLFYNVPARRKYLKQQSTEFAHVNTVVTSYALANPDVAVSLTHDGRETFATTGQGDRREAVLSVYGRDVARSMVEVDASADDEDFPDGPLEGVTGLVSHPETTRSTREYCSTYVNGRYVTASAVRDAVVDAYGTQLAPDRYPFAVLFLDLPAGDVDVNVHPRKLEVRFADEAGVREQIRAAVEAALLEEGFLRSGAPRGKSAPEQTEIAPERGGESGSGSAAETDGERAASDGADTERDESEQRASASTADRTESRSSPPASGRTSTDDDGRATPEPAEASDAPADAESSDESAETGTADPMAVETTDAPQPSDPHDRRRKFSERHDQARLSGDGADSGGPAAGADGTTATAAEPTDFDGLPSMRVLGQLHETYVLAETETGLVLIDQHAADERVNYERLRESFAGETTTQALAEPVELSLTAGEAELFETHREALATLGFRAERVDDRTVEVRTVPSLVAEAADPDLLRDALAAFVTEGSAAETVEAAADELLADLACYPSVTGNTSLTEGSVRDLLAALDDCENPWACPHGRPVVIEIDRDEIEARFERDYPGH